MCFLIALTPGDIRGLLQPAFSLANELKNKFDAFQATAAEFLATDVPFVTVCLYVHSIKDMV